MKVQPGLGGLQVWGGGGGGERGHVVDVGEDSEGWWTASGLGTAVVVREVTRQEREEPHWMPTDWVCGWAFQGFGGSSDPERNKVNGK